LTSNALAQLITAPYIGKLSDRYGRRPLLLACVCGTFISFVILFFSTSIEMILVSRILDGLLGGNISLAQAYIADITDEKDRSKGFGVLGAAFGLAFIFGPATGAIVLSKYNSTKIPSMIAAVLSLCNLLAIYFFLPESFTLKTKPPPPVATKKEDQERDTNHDGFLSGWWRFHFPIRNVSEKLFTFLVLRFGYGVVFSLFETTFGLFTSSVLLLPAKTSNLYFVYVGIFFSGIQFRIRRVAMPSNETKVIGYSFLVAGMSIFLMSLCTSSTLLLVVLLPFSLATGLLNTLVGSNITKAVNKDEQGAALGVSSSIGCITRILSPVVGGFIFEKIGYWAPGALGAFMAFSMVWYCNKRHMYLTKEATS